MSFVSSIPSISYNQPVGLAQAVGPYAAVPPVSPVASPNSGNRQGKPDSQPRFSSSAFLAQLIAQSDDSGATSAATATAAYVAAGGDATEGYGGTAGQGGDQPPAGDQDSAQNAAYLAQFIAGGAAPSSLAQQITASYERTQARGRPAANSNQIASPNLPQAQASGHIVDMVA